MRKTKIVCTIGPATQSEKMLAKLMDAGMNVARLNFSHGAQGQHGTIIARIRKVAKEKNKPIAILQDLAGPKIRIRDFKNSSVVLESGQTFTLTIDDIDGDRHRVAVTYLKLPEEVKEKDRILLADGAIELEVKKKDANNVTCEVIVGGELSSKKGLNLPGTSLSVEALTDKDKKDLRFGLENDVDYVAMSFVRRLQDIQPITRIMDAAKKRIPIIAKIEKYEAIQNIDEIIKGVDGIMVARGDLAVETALERVPLAQKMLIRKCIQACKPVITATQMLKSMVDNPRPTRAEANDVANAVIDGTDAVMLSEETTIGNFPVEAVQTMVKIIEATESSKFADPQKFERRQPEAPSIAHAVSHAAFDMAKTLNAAAVLTPTQSGSTARMVSANRPDHTIIALSPDEAVVRRLNLVWGVYPILSDGFLTSEEMLEQAKDKALTSGLVDFGDIVVITAGIPIGIAGTTNLIKAEVLR